MAILLGAMLALVPLLLTPNLQLFFDVTPKAAVLLLGAAIALVLSTRGHEGLRAVLASRPGKWFCALLLADLLWMVASTALSVDRPLSASGTNWRRFGLPTHVALVVITLVSANWFAARPERVHSVMKTMSVVGFVAAIYGICQYFGWDPWLPRAAYQSGEGEWTIVRPPSTLGHAGYFATWLLFPVFASVGQAMEQQQRLWRLVCAASAVAGAAAIVVSGTRAALIGLVLGTVTLALRKRVATTRASVAVALAAGGALAAFYYSPAGAMLRSRVHWIGEDIRGGARLWLWRDTFRMAAGRPLTGYGPETFSEAFPRFQSAALAKAYPDFYHESPHNLFLDALSQGGIPGFALLLGLIAVVMVAGFRARKDHSKTLTVGLVAVLVALQFTPVVIPVALYSAVVSAILIAQLASGKALVAASVPRRIVLAVALPIAFSLAGVAVRWWIADTMLLRTSRAIERGDVRSAAPEFRKARRWGANTDLWYSRKMLLAAQQASDPADRLLAWEDALVAASRAVTHAEDRHNARYNMAAFCASQNNFKGSEENLRAAIALAPTWFKAHWMLARALETAGRLPEAEAEASLAVDLNAGKNPEVYQTLESIRAALAKVNSSPR